MSDFSVRLMQQLKTLRNKLQDFGFAINLIDLLAATVSNINC